MGKNGRLITPSEYGYTLRVGQWINDSRNGATSATLDLSQLR
jgi:hypothetical protein